MHVSPKSMGRKVMCVPAECTAGLKDESCHSQTTLPLTLTLPLFLPPPMTVQDVDPVRRDHLLELLDIDLKWRMHKVSDGQRRRVQICMGLLRPFQVASPPTLVLKDNDDHDVLSQLNAS